MTFSYDPNHKEICPVCGDGERKSRLPCSRCGRGEQGYWVNYQGESRYNMHAAIRDVIAQINKRKENK